VCSSGQAVAVPYVSRSDLDRLDVLLRRYERSVTSLVAITAETDNCKLIGLETRVVRYDLRQLRTELTKLGLVA
jgi:hypothetical protein